MGTRFTRFYKLFRTLRLRFAYSAIPVCWQGVDTLKKIVTASFSAYRCWVWDSGLSEVISTIPKRASESFLL